jgi:hypothetical protein
MVTSFIEGRQVAFEQIIKLVTELVRQLSIDNGKKLAYAACDASNRPP